MRLLSQEI